MLCVFTFAAYFLLYDLSLGDQLSTNVEEISAKFISPCPIASIRFGPGGRPWRIYKPRCSTIHTEFHNKSFDKERCDPNYQDLEPSAKGDWLSQKDPNKNLHAQPNVNEWLDAVSERAVEETNSLHFHKKSVEEKENKEMFLEKENLFLIDKPYQANSLKSLAYLYERQTDDAVKYSSSGFTTVRINEESLPIISSSNVRNYGSEETATMGLEKSLDLLKNVHYNNPEQFEIYSETTSSNIPENAIINPDLITLKRSYGKHMKNPSENEDGEDQLKKALLNFSDFVTIKYILGSSQNSSDSLEILDNILERLSLSPPKKEEVVTEGATSKMEATFRVETLRPLPVTTQLPTTRFITATPTTRRSHHFTPPHKPSKSPPTAKSSKYGPKGNASILPFVGATCKPSTVGLKPSTPRTKASNRPTPASSKVSSSTAKVQPGGHSSQHSYPVFDESGLFPHNQNQSVRDYVTYMSERAACMHYKNTLAQWNLETNMSHVTHKQAMVTGLELIHFQRTLNRYLEPLAKENIQDPMLQREIKLLYLPGMSILPDIKIAEFEEILFAMDTIYSSATVNKWNNPQIRLHIEDIITAMKRSQSPEELKYYWVEWRSATGHKLRSLFEQYIELQNLTAISNGFSDAGEMWTRDYETEDFMQLVGCHWEEMRPLYQELHAYVRARLHKYYGEVAIKCNHSPIPTHLTGELWGQSWKYLYNITEPYPRANCNFSPDLKTKGFSKSKLISQTEHFFQSLGFPALPEGFWKRSVLHKSNTEMTCLPSSWDMHDGHDFRIKMCFNGTLEDYLALYHQLAYIQYYREYRNLSFPFRRGPNPAFHEGIAGALMLSIQSPTYLNRMGILKLPNTKEGDINFLLNVALEKLAYLPYSYIVDLWRFRVFTGEIKPNDYNEKWWKMRLQYQGIIPPVRRTSEDFDPGSEYHIATNKPYLQNFISTILQFQFFEALCRKSGKISEKTPLHKCDLSNTPQVGNLLRYVMQLGASRHWRVAMKSLTDSRQINSRALLEYFSPLYDWLKKENFKTGQRVGWSDHLELA